MRMLAPWGAMSYLLAAQATPPPLTFHAIQARARATPAQHRTEANLATHRWNLLETSGGLREGPTLSVQTGPRRTPGASNDRDQALEIDLPLFQAPHLRQRLERALGAAHPLLQDAARREDALRLRIAYLDAWWAERVLALRAEDLATVEAWLEVTRVRVREGVDPAFQVTLVAGELAKARLDMAQARAERIRTWRILQAWADLPSEPQPLADPDPLPSLPPLDFETLRAGSPLHQALRAEAELDLQALRLEAARTQARWSLRASHAREGEERVTRLGFALRLPRPGEGTILRRATEARVRTRSEEAALALAELDARLQALLDRWSDPSSDPPPDAFLSALRALGLRLSEGRERPSEALPLRRQLLEGHLARLQRDYQRQRDAAELQAFLPQVTP